MGQKIYIFKFHMIQIPQRVQFFLKNKHDYKCDIDFIQQFNINVNSDMLPSAGGLISHLKSIFIF